MAHIEIPTLPNFVTVKTHGAEVKVDVTTLTDAEIADLGARWTAALMEHRDASKEHHKVMDRLSGMVSR